MEIKEKQQSKKDTKKFKVGIKDGSDIWSNLVSFYREHIMILHIVMFVIALILFGFSFFTTLPKVKSGGVNIDPLSTVKGLGDLLREDALLSIVVIFAGITPYCYLSIIGLAQSMVIVDQMALRYAFGSGFFATSLIGGIIQVIGIALCVAVGLYYCKLSTKKNKYYHQSSFGMDDVKASFYDLRKDEKKLEELNKKREEKAKKIEEANIKIPYLNIILLGVVGCIIQVVGTLIAVI
ncbi:MAG: hypothetical protein IKD74_01315 [Clostridia bacterium]|nr:hypothetical protein [Clostridia bacterium]